MKRFLFILACGWALCTCKNIEPTDCSVAECSEQFNTVTLTVKYSDNTPVILDTFRVVSLEDHLPITFSLLADEWEQMRIRGRYAVADDRLVPSRQNTRMEVAFTAVFKNQEITQRVLLNIDCCHVTPVGDSAIVLPKPTFGDCVADPCAQPRDSTFGVTLSYTDNRPVALDTFQLINLLTNQPIDLSFSSEEFAEMQATGRYPLVNTTFLNSYTNIRAAIQFIGLINSEVVVRRNLMLDIDCCHVSLFSGDRTIVI
jgi:hypothetical protein